MSCSVFLSIVRTIRMQSILHCVEIRNIQIIRMFYERLVTYLNQTIIFRLCKNNQIETKKDIHIQSAKR